MLTRTGRREATAWVKRRVPTVLQPSARRTLRWARHARARQLVRWGNLRRLAPFDADWGSHRGHPIDRYYIDAFLREHRSLVTGRVLEVKEDLYATDLSASVVTVDIVDIDPHNHKATVVADLGEAGSLPTACFDCVIVTQTLQFVDDVGIALDNLWGSLAPGGSLLLSVPCISKLEPSLAAVESWRVLPAGLQRLIREHCPDSDVSVRAAGNVLVATAFLMGLAVDDLRPDELQFCDPLYPIVVLAAITKHRSPLSEHS
jgi:SAM-dependent methyltransferase